MSRTICGCFKTVRRIQDGKDNVYAEDCEEHQSGEYPALPEPDPPKREPTISDVVGKKQRKSFAL